MFFKNLPDEIVLKIFSKVSNSDQAQLTNVDKHCQRLASDKTLEYGRQQNANKLLKAVSSHDIKRTKEFLSKGADPNYIYEKDNFSPNYFVDDANCVKMNHFSELIATKVIINLAIVRGYADIVEVLLKFNARQDIQNSYYGTPLHIAAFHHKAKIAKLLIDHGADINARTMPPWSKTPYETACSIWSVKSEALNNALKVNTQESWDAAIDEEKRIESNSNFRCTLV